jgi:hypothetical protein
MRSRPFVDLLRPGSPHPSLTAFGADYPIPLLTRRTFGMNGEAVLSQRSSAPCPIAFRPFRSHP